MNDMGSSNADLLELVSLASLPDALPEETEAPSAPMVAFRAGAHWFAVPAGTVREIVARDAITRVPGAPAHILGVALVHGRLVPVLDLPAVVATSASGPVAFSRPRLVVLTWEGVEVAIVAEETRGVLDLVIPEVLAADTSIYLRNEIRWENQLLVLLDVAAVVAVMATESGV